MLFPALLAALPCLQGSTQDLKEIEGTLRRATDRASYEAGAYQAARRLALEFSGVEAMRLRLELFDSKMETYRGVYLRDWFYTGMQRAATVEEGAMLAEAAADKKRSELSRVLCLRALAACPGPVPAAALLDKDFLKAPRPVALEWQRTVGKLHSQGRLDAGGFKGKDLDGDLRKLLLQAGPPLSGLALLAELSPAERAALFSACVAASDPRDRAEALRALANRTEALRASGSRADAEPGQLLAAVKLALDGKHCGWRRAALDAVLSVPLAEAAPLLIDQLEKEAAGPGGRFLLDVAHALMELTGQQLGADPATWRRWWEAQGEEWLRNAPRDRAGTGGRNAEIAGQTTARLFGLPVNSKRVVVVVDGSGSMLMDKLGEQSCAEAAAGELEKYLDELPEDAAFNVVVVGAELTGKAAFKTLAVNSARNRTAALKFLRGYDFGGTSSLYDVLAEVQNQPETDTILLISDGGSSSGSHQYGGHMLERLAQEHARTGVRIHCVCVGKDAAKVEFMSELAKMTGGKMVQPSK